jgi:glycosyltransferase involved in cell wall biosynthesis
VWNIRESADWRQYYSVRFPHLNRTALSTMRIPYRVIFVADSTRAMYEELNTRGNFSTIHNGIDLTEIKDSIGNLTVRQAREMVGHPPGKTVFTIVGTVCPRKGQLEFAQGAISLLKQGVTNAYFCIVGGRGNAYQQEIEKAIKPYKEHFALLPETKDIHPYFRASDVFVCCSNNESYPRVILEAMAFGLPIITTNVFGISEQVCGGVSALTYAPTDVRTLSSHMRKLMSDPGERMRLGENARIALAGLTTYDQMVDAYERILLEAFYSRRQQPLAPARTTPPLLEVA